MSFKLETSAKGCTPFSNWTRPITTPPSFRLTGPEAVPPWLVLRRPCGSVTGTDGLILRATNEWQSKLRFSSRWKLTWKRMFVFKTTKNNSEATKAISDECSSQMSNGLKWPCLLFVLWRIMRHVRLVDTRPLDGSSLSLEWEGGTLLSLQVCSLCLLS